MTALPAPIGRRRFLALGGAAAASAVLAACGGDDSADDAGAATTTGDATGGGDASETTAAGGSDAAAEISGTLVLYNYADYVDPATYEAFTAKYPNVTIETPSYASEEEVSAQLAAGGTSQYDVIVVAGTTAKQLNDSGFLMPIDQALIPNLANVDPVFIDSAYDPGAVFSVPKNFGITGIGYDSAVVTTPPADWAEFFEMLPQYAPKTLIH
jgi:spermidine/putrescine transport system substrate-binding protein